jgi:pimeloyl-ACP methyl ester carboxylesterase
MRRPPLKSALVTCRFDRRFSYALAVPDVGANDQPPGLVVTVHNSVRWYRPCLDGFRGFGQRHGQVVMAPLFPPDLLGDGNADGYKVLHEGPLRYDEVLNAMVAEVAAATGCDADRFFLHGYSGGGQFVHRYLMLHPQRVRAAAIGAPGAVTLLDDDVDWWAGVRDMGALFGRRIDLSALRGVPVQLVVGEQDTDASLLRLQPPSRFWGSEPERLHADRIARLRALQRSLQSIGMEPGFELMPGVNHGEGDGPSIALAQGLFAEQLATQH